MKRIQPLRWVRTADVPMTREYDFFGILLIVVHPSVSWSWGGING